ncbi:MAG: DUF3280 domain-containing protein [Methylocella sp.]|jgi:hypothetical protein
MIRAVFLTYLIAVTSMPVTGHAAIAAPLQRLLVLDFEIVDTSNEPVDHRAEHERRLGLIHDTISDDLAARNIYVIVDRAPIRAELDAILQHQFLRSCNGCGLALAQHAGADLVMLGRFNKISTLIGNMHILIKDANTGAIVYTRTFGFRGDTDEAWLHAAKFFVEGFAKTERSAPRAAPSVEQ